MKTKPLPVIVSVVLIMALAIFMTACGGSQDSESTDAVKSKSPKTSTESKDASITGKKQHLPTGDGDDDTADGWIKRVRLVPQKNGKDFFWKIDVKTAKKLKENQHLTYVYFVNHEKSPERGENLIPISVVKKGDFLSAEVFFNQDDTVLQRKRTAPFLVGNMAPVIESVTIPKINGPGIYTFTVVASDHDEDAITFTLEPPTGQKTLDSHLQIDASTGTVSYTLTEEAKPKELRFIITADDGDGGKAKKIVTVPFKQKTVIQKKEPEPEESENTGE